MIVRKKEIYTYRFLETGGRVCHLGPHGEGPASIRRQKDKWGDHGLESLD